MITDLLWLVPYLTDAGNIIFFFAGLPQLWKTWKNRNDPEKLEGLSSKMMLGYVLSFILFGTLGFIVDGYATFILNIFNIIFFLLQVYWKSRGEKNG